MSPPKLKGVQSRYWDEIVKYHHQLKEHELEQTLGDSGGQEPGYQHDLVTEWQNKMKKKKNF